MWQLSLETARDVCSIFILHILLSCSHIGNVSYQCYLLFFLHKCYHKGIN